MTDDEVRALLKRSRAAQGLPPVVTDPEALAKAAALVVDAMSSPPSESTAA
ncbi:MAG TPA: hypothetical protein VGB14_13360 [Acidimicrobiales bacterium]